MDDLKLYSCNEKRLNSLVQTIGVFSEDIGMEFAIEKSAMFVTEKREIVKSIGKSCQMVKLLRHYRKVKL